MTGADAITLPDDIITKRQLVRFLHALEAVDGALTTASARSTVSAAKLEKLTIDPTVTEFFKLNKADIRNSTSRSHMVAQLRKIRTKAPIVHLTFASEVDEASLARISKWLRETAHAHTLIEVGLQPGLVAGVYMRMTNRIFDYSLRAKLESQRGLLVKALGGEA